jgi:nitroreductase
MNVIESLKWRSAIKKFDPTKKVTDEDLEKLLEAANLTATSGGLQPFKLVVVSDSGLKKQLVKSSYNQSQVEEASHVLVFAVETEINEGTVDRYVERAAELRGQEKESLIGYADSMKMYMNSMDESAKYAWAKNQAFIALGTVLAVAATLRVDSCPMEGIMPNEYQEILGLKPEGLMPVVVLTVGYKSSEDVHSREVKVRKKRSDFILEIN